MISLFKNKRRMIGEILVDRGVATARDIEESLRIQEELLKFNKMQKRLGEILREKGVVSDADIMSALEEQERFEKNSSKGFLY